MTINQVQVRGEREVKSGKTWTHTSKAPHPSSHPFFKIIPYSMIQTCDTPSRCCLVNGRITQYPTMLVALTLH
jgi:hypothetical protein